MRYIRNRLAVYVWFGLLRICGDILLVRSNLYILLDPESYLNATLLLILGQNI